MSYAHDIAAALIRRGFALRPTVDPDRYPQRDKVPGDDQCRPVKWNAAQHLARALTEDQVEQYERFSMVVGSHDSPTRWLDVETDPPDGETLLAQRVALPGYGPTMTTENKSIHRLVEPLPPPDGHKLRRGRWAFDHQPGVDIPWHFVAVDHDKRIWKGLNDPCPIIGEPLWVPTVKPVARSARARAEILAPPSPRRWIPPAMRRALEQSPPGSGKHLRTNRLVIAGWIHAAMSRDAIWRTVANDPTCLAWVADGRNFSKLSEDVDRILRSYCHWDRQEDRYRHFVELGRDLGVLTGTQVRDHFGRNGHGDALERAERDGHLCCRGKGPTGGGRGAAEYRFVDPFTNRCPAGHFSPFRP